MPFDMTTSQRAARFLALAFEPGCLKRGWTLAEVQYWLEAEFEKAIAAEREACATLAEQQDFYHKSMNDAAESIAKQIRERENQPCLST